MDKPDPEAKAGAGDLRIPLDPKTIHSHEEYRAIWGRLPRIRAVMVEKNGEWPPPHVWA
jgi:hypothetical protein